MTEIRDATDIAGVLTTLDGLVDRALADDARWGLFAALYREVTRAVAAAIDAGRFVDAERMSRFDAAFANRYFEALRVHLRGESPGPAWRITFDAGPRNDLTALQHLLLGINAHINVDLGLSVVEAGIDPTGFRDDFVEINRILEDVLDRAQSVLGEVSPVMRQLDRLLGEADEYLGLFIIARARDQAWLAAVLADALAPAHRDALESTLDAAAAHLAKRITDPGPATAAAVTLMRRLESWTVAELTARFDGMYGA